MLIRLGQELCFSFNGEVCVTLFNILVIHITQCVRVMHHLLAVWFQRVLLQRRKPTEGFLPAAEDDRGGVDTHLPYSLLSQSAGKYCATYMYILCTYIHVHTCTHSRSSIHGSKSKQLFNSIANFLTMRMWFLLVLSWHT